MFNRRNRRCPSAYGEGHPVFGAADTVSDVERIWQPPVRIRVVKGLARILVATLLICSLTSCEDKAMTEEIYNVKRQNAAQLMSLPGVVSVGIGQDQNGEPAIVVGLEAAAPATQRQVPERIGGYPVIVQTVGTIKAQ